VIILNREMREKKKVIRIKSQAKVFTTGFCEFVNFLLFVIANGLRATRE